MDFFNCKLKHTLPTERSFELLLPGFYAMIDYQVAASSQHPRHIRGAGPAGGEQQQQGGVPTHLPGAVPGQGGALLP